MIWGVSWRMVIHIAEAWRRKRYLVIMHINIYKLVHALDTMDLITMYTISIYSLE
jgi:hypothetical protein